MSREKNFHYSNSIPDVKFFRDILVGWMLANAGVAMLANDGNATLAPALYFELSFIHVVVTLQCVCCCCCCC